MQRHTVTKKVQAERLNADEVNRANVDNGRTFSISSTRSRP